MILGCGLPPYADSSSVEGGVISLPARSAAKSRVMVMRTLGEVMAVGFSPPIMLPMTPIVSLSTESYTAFLAAILGRARAVGELVGALVGVLVGALVGGFVTDQSSPVKSS